MTTKILELANDFSTFHKKYNNEIIEHVLIENSNIDAGIIGNTAISTADIQIDNTVIRFATSRAIANNDLLSYDENQFKFVNKSLAELTCQSVYYLLFIKKSPGDELKLIAFLQFDFDSSEFVD